jgi:hypothetical protein
VEQSIFLEVCLSSEPGVHWPRFGSNLPSKSITMNMKAALIALLVSLSVAHAQEDVSKVETRKEAEKFRKEGNWKDALELDRKLLGQSDDSRGCSGGSSGELVPPAAGCALLLV